MRTLWLDVKFAARLLSKGRAFTAVALVTLALGIGANTAIFSVVNTVLLTPLRYKQPDRLVMVWEYNHPLSHPENTASPANYLEWRDRNTVFEQLAATADEHDNLTGSGEPEQVAVQDVTPNLFSILGVEPLFGRTFTAEDGIPGHDDVVILSFGIWQRKYGGDRNILGQKIYLNSHPQTVVGVMPRGFQLFVKEGTLIGEPSEIWTPFAFTARAREQHGRWLTCVARLKPGVSLAQAQAEMDALSIELQKKWPQADMGWTINLVPLKEQFTGGIRPALLVLLGAVAFVLLIACANVANLFLARAASRRKEIAIRAALGAGRVRIARQLITESVLLAGLGGALGLFVAIWGTDGLLALGPKELLGVSHVSTDGRVLAFTLGVSLITGVLFGIAPSLAALRTDVNTTLKEGSREGSFGGRGNRLRSALVVAEIGLALVLLTGAGLLGRSFSKLLSVDPGFNPHNLLTMRLTLPNSAYPQDQNRSQFFRQLLERVDALPGVRSASASSWLPFTGLGAATGLTVEGRPPLAPGVELVCDVRVIEPDYFRTLGIPLLRGREFTERESSVESHVVIVSEALAREYFPNEDPLGKRITIEMKDPKDNPPSEIIGIVGDVKHQTLDTAIRPMVYWPHPELAYGFMSLAVRTDGDPLRLAGAVRQQVRALDPNLAVSGIATMDQLLATSVAQARFSTLLLSIFAAVALLLAAVGIYGVMAYGVMQRVREIGIRMALGADAGTLKRMVLRDALRLSVAGIAIGLLAAFGLTRLMASLLFGVTPHDPVTFFGVAALLSFVALAASYIPARRATRVDPMVALRYE